MSFLKTLSEVYDHNIHRIGVFEEKGNHRFTLLPISHLTLTTQIEITVDFSGNFINAKVVDQERTIVPMTLNSANRSGSAIYPHYLHDKLFYVAGDYFIYTGEEKRKNYFSKYKEQMEEWASDPSAPKEVIAVYKYIRKENVMKDLVESNILHVDEEGFIIKRIPGREKPELYKLLSNVLDAVVRFNVLQPNNVPLWENVEIFNNFVEFTRKTSTLSKGYCYVSGEETFLTTQHGGSIRRPGDRPKLISDNDKRGFTYLGRFMNSQEAVQIGFDSSQKAHHALRWLIQRQGTYVDTRYFIAFGIEKVNVPQPFSSGLDFLSENLKQQATQGVLTETIIANEIIKAMQGYKVEFEKVQLKHITIMSVDAATTGRLAVVYYQQMHSHIYLEKIKEWHTTCYWLQTDYDQNIKGYRRYEGTPSIYKIANAVFGSRADDRFKKELYTRLLPCVTEGKKIPADIVHLGFNRVINPHSFSSKGEWENTLNVICALINKLYESEGYTVALQEQNNSRDYLFGRLLGVAEVMERNYLRGLNESRSTNATRYFNAFSQHPSRTWYVIRKQLTPYFQRHGDRATRYAKLIQEIESRIAIEDMTDKALSPIFLLGYSSQIQDMYRKREEKEDDSITKEN